MKLPCKVLAPPNYFFPAPSVDEDIVAVCGRQLKSLTQSDQTRSDEVIENVLEIWHFCQQKASTQHFEVLSQPSSPEACSCLIHAALYCAYTHTRAVQVDSKVKETLPKLREQTNSDRWINTKLFCINLNGFIQNKANTYF